MSCVRILRRCFGWRTSAFCSAGGLSAKSGRLELTFLVRARGRAEGVEVQRVKGAPEAAGACVQKLLKNRRVGTPSEDPVGVTVSFELAR